MDEIMKIDDVEKILVSSKDDIDTIFDENARAQYVLAVAKIYETKVKEKELEQQAQNKAFENQLKEKECRRACCESRRRRTEICRNCSRNCIAAGAISEVLE